MAMPCARVCWGAHHGAVDVLVPAVGGTWLVSDALVLVKRDLMGET